MIPLLKSNIAEDTHLKISEVFKSGYLADGKEVRRFEANLAEFIGNPRIVTINNEASAILLALYMAGVRPGDEVLASPMTCTASTMPVLNLFAKVKWCDIDPETGMLAPTEIVKNAGSKTKALLHSHWAGEVNNVYTINAVARQHGLKVIEDASEGFGSAFDGKPLGCQGTDYTVFSFGPVRHLTTSDGAAIFFADDEEYRRGINLKRYGINRETFKDEVGEINPNSDIPIPGYNFYMNNVCASIGIAQMEKIAQTLNAYRENGEYYRQTLKGIDGIKPLRRHPLSHPSYWVFALLAERRDDLLRALRKEGTESSKLHIRNDIYSCYQTGLQKHFEGVKKFSENVLCIPCGPWVGRDEREKIVAFIRKGW